jgi:hypothetical protein
MKKHLLILLVFTSLFSSAQKIEKFFDYRWKPCGPSNARYYALIQFKDSLWSRVDYFINEKELQMQGSYRDSACKIPVGKFYYFHPNEKLESTGNYVNGKKEGVWLKYYSNGYMKDSTFYINGHPSGISMGWYANGYPADSVTYNANNERAAYISWFDNGNPSSAGYKINDSLHGKWSFFHKNGNISAVEVYDRGKLISRQYFDEEGKEMADTSSHDHQVEFNGGEKAWRKYILSKLYFPTQYKITGGDKAIVVVDATIDEDGNVLEAEVSSPFHPDFDEIALKTMKNSPKWKPAVDHNRKVKSYIIQPVTFAQVEY